MKEEVRCRCVVQDVRDGTSAVMHGYSSPTSGVETLKLLLAIAGFYDLAVLTADVSTAYMSSPLPPDVRAIIRLPTGTYFADGTPVYMVLFNALNGLRPASLAWVLYFRNVVQQKLGLDHCEIDPTLYVGWWNGQWVAVLTYVDDVLFVASNLDVCRKMLQELCADLESKETGAIGSSSEVGASNELTFLGRRIFRSGSKALSVSIEKAYCASLEKSGKGLKAADVLPDMKHFLEDESETAREQLSAEKQTEFRSILGKILWLVPFRPDLSVATSLISTGQAIPEIRHQRALKALLWYVLGTLQYGQSFPMEAADEYLRYLSDVDQNCLVIFADASFAPMRDAGPFLVQ